MSRSFQKDCWCVGNLGIVLAQIWYPFADCFGIISNACTSINSRTCSWICRPEDWYWAQRSNCDFFQWELTTTAFGESSRQLKATGDSVKVPPTEP